MPELSPSPFGRLLREWRTARGKSQLALALDAGVSTRHLSFIETGRASPSRQMVLLLAQSLDMPLRECNVLLGAAGYAPLFAETPFDAPQMERVRLALEAILRAHRNPTVVLNRRCDVLMSNQAAQRLMAHLLPPESLSLASNIVRLIFSPEGARRLIENWDEVASEIAFRLRRESPASDVDSLRAIVGADVELPSTLSRVRAVESTYEPTISLPIRIRKGELRLDLFSTITTLGTPLDVTAQELRVESLFAIDAASERQLDAIVAFT